VKPNKKAATSATHDNSTANVTATAVSKQSAPPKADSKFVTTGSTKTETTNVASSSTKPDTTRVAANSTNSESAGASKNESASLSKTENVTTDTTKRTKKPAYTFNSGNPSDLNFSVETVRKVSNTSRQTDPNKNSTTETSTPKTAQATATKPAEQTRSSSLVAEKGVSDPKAPANTTAEATKTETMNGWESSSKPQSNDATIATATLPDVASHAVPSETTDPAANAGQPGGDLKQTFTDIIQSWQNIKKAAVKSKDLTELPQVLSGKTLIRQSDAIKWLVTNHKYYDMTPKGVVVDRIVDLGKGQKYAVYAQVKEYSKYMDDATNQVLKVTDDVYNVNYTLEKTGDKWLISDSAILNLPPKAIAGKTTSAKTNKSR
jgi:hypothetical protein